MNDNRAGIGTNWGAPRPRTVMEAFPMGIAGEYQSQIRKERKERIKAVLMVILWAATFLGGCFLGPIIQWAQNFS